MRKTLSAGVGGVFVVTGFVVFWTPIPLGIPLMLIGLPLIMRNSPRSWLWLKQRARRSPRFESLLDRIEAQRDSPRPPTQ